MKHSDRHRDLSSKAESVIAKLYEMAMGGNVNAAGLFLDRVLGASSPAVGFAPVGSSLLAPTKPELARPESLAATGLKAPEKPRTMLSVAEVAEQLGLSTRTISQLAAKGRLPICRIGRRILVRAADLERFVQENSSGP